MKKVLLLFLCFSLLAAFAVPFKAETGMDVLSAVAEVYKDEQNDVRLAVEASMNEYDSYLGSTIDDISFSLMYQCFSLYNSNFVRAYEESGNFADNISDKYSWVVSNYNRGGEVDVVANNESEFGWSVSGARKLRVYSNVDKLDIESVYNCILEEYPDADPESFCNLYSEYIDCKLIYFTSEGEEYLFPMFMSNEDPSWAQSGVIYSAKDFVERAVPEFENELKDSGIISWIQENIDIIIAVSVCVLVLVVIICIIAKKKKDKKEKEES